MSSSKAEAPSDPRLSLWARHVFLLLCVQLWLYETLSHVCSPCEYVLPWLSLNDGHVVATIAGDAEEGVRYGRKKTPMPAGSPNPQVLELTHLPKGLCLESQQGWPHLSVFSLDFIQSTPQNGPQSLKYGNFIPSRRKCSEKNYILPFK